MSFRARLTLVAAGAVAVALVVGSVVIYLVVAASTRSQVDDSLRRQELLLAGGSGPSPPPVATGDGQIVGADGAVTPLRPDSLTLPFVTDARAVAAGRRPSFFRDVRLGQVHLRVLVAPLADGRAVEVALPLDRVDDLLHRLRVVLLVVTSTGIVFALVAGRLVAGAALGPVVRLRAAAREVATSRRPGRRVPVEGGDELADLASTFNDMLAALEKSLEAQRALVADASHELRTPLTSLRANVEFLLREPGLAEHRALLSEVGTEVEGLGRLVDDLVELARDEQPDEPLVDVRLDEMVAVVVDRARRRAPALVFVTDLGPAVVEASPGRLERAVANVVDNAAKWSPDGSTVEVSVAAGEVVVRDHGPGIDPADIPHVFDRFYRSGSARRVPGSGLGLAIVRQVAESHGGSVAAELPLGGGTRIRLTLPAVDPDPGDDAERRVTP